MHWPAWWPWHQHFWERWEIDREGLIKRKPSLLEREVSSECDPVVTGAYTIQKRQCMTCGLIQHRREEF